MKYETPKMEIVIFDDSDIATNLQASGVGTGANPSEGEDIGEDLGFGGGSN